MKYTILLLLCLMAVIAYVQRAAISVPAKAVASDLGVSKEDSTTAMGWVQSAWYLGYALLQMPSGRLADRLGSRLTAAIFCAGWSLLTAITGFSTSLGSLMVCWFCMGALQAGAFPCAARAIRQVFPETQRARASGTLAAGMMIGTALAPLAAGHGLSLLEHSSLAVTNWQPWQLLLLAFSIPGLLWAIAFPAAVPARYLPPVPVEDAPALLPMLYQMSRSAPLFLLCAQQFLRASAMVFFLTWFPTFLQETRGVNVKQSANLTFIAGLGGIIGSLTGGVASDWLLRTTGNRWLARQGLAVIGMLLCSTLIVLSIFAVNTQLSIVLISCGVFCATFGGVSGYTVAIELGGRQTATVFSLMNMCGNFGSMLFPITASWLVTRFNNWNVMLVYFAGMMIVDAICWAFLKPRGSLFPDTDTSA
ncbi:MAG: putative sulfoacetate transporter SauU [Planctomycetota bacterium]